MVFLEITETYARLALFLEATTFEGAFISKSWLEKGIN